MRNCLILGSGRSGTSMIGGILHQAGYFVGDLGIQGKLRVWSANIIGRVPLVGGTATVTTDKITSNANILLTTQIPGGTVGTPYVSARTGTGFTITSTSPGDTSQVGWFLVDYI